MATKKNGLIQELGPNGKIIKETEYVDGKKHGLQTCYDPDGNPVKITTYENNTRVYEETFYKGQIVSKIPYFNGKKEGNCVLFENGVKKSETAYANGKKDGIEIIYHPNGVIEAQKLFHNGKLDNTDLHEYHKNGNPSRTIVKNADGTITNTEYRLDNGIPTVQYVSNEDGIFIKSTHFYLSGVIGKIERPGQNNTEFFDPNGNKISSAEYWATGLENYVGWGNWNYPAITELDFIARRDAEAASRMAKRRNEMKDFGVAFTEPLKITPVKFDAAPNTNINPNDTVSMVTRPPNNEYVDQRCSDAPAIYQQASKPEMTETKPRLGFWGKLLAKIA